jgi:hypothetical protein
MPLPTILLLADAVLLGLLVAFAPPGIAFVALVPGSVLAVVVCELLARRTPPGGGNGEPWRLDGWSTIVGTFGVLGLAGSLGSDAIGVAWLLVALFAGLGLASLPNLAPRPRP